MVLFAGKNCVIHVCALREYACVLKWRHINILPFLFSFHCPGCYLSWHSSN